MNEIGQTIKDRRKDLLITQGELAELAGININTLTKIELGEGNPTMGTLTKVLDTLGLEVVLRVKKINI